MGDRYRKIWCCGCASDVDARLTSGAEIYPHRRDLSKLPFWRCDTCRNFIGCHHKTKDRTRPLGCIPTPELKTARQHIHRLLDPIWQGGSISRRDAYTKLAGVLDLPEYHTAEIRTIEDARRVYKAVRELKRLVETEAA